MIWGWVQILGKEPLPYLQDLFAYVRNEESQHSTMLHSTAQEHSDLATISQHNSKGDSRSRDGKMIDSILDEQDKLFCDHCNRSQHTQETCWKLHGRPARGRGDH